MLLLLSGGDEAEESEGGGRPIRPNRYVVRPEAPDIDRSRDEEEELLALGLI